MAPMVAGHQEAFIEYLSVFDSFGSFDKYVIADHKVRDEVQPEPEDPGYRAKVRPVRRPAEMMTLASIFSVLFTVVPPSV